MFAREGKEEKAEHHRPDDEHGLDDEDGREVAAVLDLQHQHREREDDERLEEREEREAAEVPDHELAAGERRREQPLERPAGALTEERHGREQEDEEEREEPDEHRRQVIEERVVRPAVQVVDLHECGEGHVEDEVGEGALDLADDRARAGRVGSLDRDRGDVVLELDRGVGAAALQRGRSAVAVGGGELDLGAPQRLEELRVDLAHGHDTDLRHRGGAPQRADEGQDDDRRDEEQPERAPVVAELQCDPPRHRADPPQAHAGAPASVRKALSRSAAPERATRSAAVPSARSRPERMSPSRSQREASSITWLETRSVTPVAASDRKCAQKSRRRAGSTPTVGSSSRRSRGWRRSVAASETRVRIPPESVLTIERRRSRRSTRRRDSSTREPASATPSSAPKNRRFSSTDSSVYRAGA